MQDVLRSKGYKVLREKLVEARRRAGLNQTELAEILGTSQPIISTFETGTRYMELVQFIRWAHAVKLDPHKLLDEIEAAGV